LQSTSAQGIAFGDHLYFSNLASTHRGAGDAGKAFQLRLDRVVRKIVQLPLVHSFGGDRNRDHRNVGDVEFENEGLLNSSWEGVEDLRHPLRNVELSIVEIDAVAEPGAHYRNALLRDALHPIDAGGGAHGTFDGLGDRLLDVPRSGTGIKGGHPDHWDIDFRKQVHRKAPQGNEA